MRPAERDSLDIVEMIHHFLEWGVKSVIRENVTPIRVYII